MKEESPARWAAGAAAPAPAVRRRENLRSASFRDYAMAGVTLHPMLTPPAVGGRGPCQRVNTALPSPRPGVTPAPSEKVKSEERIGTAAGCGTSSLLEGLWGVYIARSFLRTLRVRETHGCRLQRDGTLSTESFEEWLSP